MVESLKKTFSTNPRLYIIYNCFFWPHLQNFLRKIGFNCFNPIQKNSGPARASRKAHKELSKLASKTGLKASKKINLRQQQRRDERCERRDVASLDFCWLVSQWSNICDPINERSHKKISLLKQDIEGQKIRVNDFLANLKAFVFHHFCWDFGHDVNIKKTISNKTCQVLALDCNQSQPFCWCFRNPANHLIL